MLECSNSLKFGGGGNPLRPLFTMVLAKQKKSFGFTLAEVLITLGIIGVVAAITIPLIMTKVDQHKTIAGLKASYSNLSQLVKRIEYEYGDVEGMNGTSNVWYRRDKKQIVEGSIAPLLPGSQVFDAGDGAANSALCFTQGVTRKHKTLSGEYQYIRPNGGAWFAGGNSRMMSIQLADGSCMGFDVAAYDDNTGVSMEVYTDINGPQQPNALGRDLFQFVVTQKGDVYPLGYNLDNAEVNKRCNNSPSTDGSGNYCASKIMRDGWKIKRDYPWALKIRGAKL